ncbi:hypothetical protein F4802DRAFT_614982 [Xylaria palmicola]|nr:hypothetical protein F4802DRAFT_614982 [Xylaria palmicola]
MDSSDRVSNTSSGESQSSNSHPQKSTSAQSDSSSKSPPVPQSRADSNLSSDIRDRREYKRVMENIYSTPSSSSVSVDPWVQTGEDVSPARSITCPPVWAKRWTLVSLPDLGFPRSGLLAIMTIVRDIKDINAGAPQSRHHFLQTSATTQLIKAIRSIEPPRYPTSAPDPKNPSHDPPKTPSDSGVNESPEQAPDSSSDTDESKRGPDG